MDIVNGFLKRSRKQHDHSGFSMVDIRPRIVCADGYNLSVQASRTHYCAPREDTGPYSQVEVGYPSARPPGTWREYSEEKWQRPDLFGTLARLWENRRQIFYALKERAKDRTWPLRVWLYLDDNSTHTIYPYIPVDLVVGAIVAHGGIDQGKTFPKEGEQA